MIKNKCLVCGSLSFRADRALSGRLICTSCGTPLGVRRNGSRRKNELIEFPINRQKIYFITILIFVFVLVVVI